MTSLRFTLPPRQRRRPVIATGVLVVVAVVAAATHALSLAIPVGCVAVILLVTYLLVMSGSYAELDESGIRSRRGVFRNTVTWAGARTVALDPRSGQVLVVHRHDGKPFKLGAPVSGGLSSDPDYRDKVDQVLAFVHTRTH